MLCSSLQIIHSVLDSEWTDSIVNFIEKKVTDYLNEDITKADLLEEFQSEHFSQTLGRLTLGMESLESLFDTLAADLGKGGSDLQTAFEMLTELEIPVVTKDNVREFAVVKAAEGSGCRCRLLFLDEKLYLLEENFPKSFQELGQDVFYPVRQYITLDLKGYLVPPLQDLVENLKTMQENLIQYGNTIKMDGDFYRQVILNNSLPGDKKSEILVQHNEHECGNIFGQPDCSRKMLFDTHYGHHTCWPRVTN